MLLDVVLVALAVALGYFVWRFSTDAARLRTRYASIVDVDTAVATARTELEHMRQAAMQDIARLREEHATLMAQAQQQRTQLSKEYEQALGTYHDLKRELSLVEEGLQDISFGLYKPHFSFQTPEEYKVALTQLRDQERTLIQNNHAAVCPVNWKVGNSAKEGERMVKQNIKLVLRAFNGECEAARADVSWNNIIKMEERIKKSAEAINKLSGVLQVTITPDYMELKLNELRLTHEHEERKYQEREEQRRIREQIREEERAQRELDKAKEEAETEEARYQKALAKARDEATAATVGSIAKAHSAGQRI